MSTTTREAGLKGSRNRWGPRRRFNIRDLDPVHRERVEAFIEAERRAQQREHEAAKGAA